MGETGASVMHSIRPRLADCKIWLKRNILKCINRHNFNIIHFMAFDVISRVKFFTARIFYLNDERSNESGNTDAEHLTQISLRQCFLHWMRFSAIRKIGYYDAPGQGAGAQALMKMGAIALARSKGLTYIHAPFSLIHHADRPMHRYAADWETHFNLGAGEVIRDEAPRGMLQFDFSSVILSLFGIDDMFIEIHRSTPEFRRKYYSNKSIRKNALPTVCVHVRRGDVTPGIPEMWTEISTLAVTLSIIRAVLDAKDIAYRICILSQGERHDFSELEGPKTEFFLNADPIWTMQEAIAADILVMAKSTFSYVAALLSDGVKIYEPFAPTPPDSWLVRDSSGEFDAIAFDLQFSSLIATRYPPV
jgi:hypothetical protein